MGYFLFGGEDYYPSGGWGDFVKAFDTKEEAVEVGKQEYERVGKWWHVVDVGAREIVDNG